jgi:hypothetical protein
MYIECYKKKKRVKYLKRIIFINLKQIFVNFLGHF